MLYRWSYIHVAGDMNIKVVYWIDWSILNIYTSYLQNSTNWNLAYKGDFCISQFNFRLKVEWMDFFFTIWPAVTYLCYFLLLGSSERNGEKDKRSLQPFDNQPSKRPRGELTDHEGKINMSRYSAFWL